jgi:hypothetical protein
LSTLLAGTVVLWAIVAHHDQPVVGLIAKPLKADMVQNLRSDVTNNRVAGDLTNAAAAPILVPAPEKGQILSPISFGKPFGQYPSAAKVCEI